ncbi:AFG1/ZapE family ATPase [Paenibacillus sp.]|uniref:AFG1/ZapE family ATPase n=1 Tax=Paenibacillus sp. TaxID=58172 RepID=UPI002D55AD3A|nr:AFG1/ZapE family ATPase [Paenibacillus sp.]HZG57556.1 AFG1/ZapE family ATPase [Paenibacillus sp.]
MESMGRWLGAAAGVGEADWKRQTMKVLNDAVVAEWIAAHPEVSREALTKNVTRLYQYAKEKKECAKCPGLERCPNDMAGHYTKLVVTGGDGVEPNVADYKVPCDLQRAKSSQDSVRARIKSFYVDEKALNKEYSPAEIISRDMQRAGAVEAVIKYVLRTRDDGLQPNGLYLQGDFGTGKTFLASYLLYELAKSGFTGVIVYTPDFVEDLKSMFGEPQKLKETIELLKDTDLLVFDDIGAEHLNAWTRDHVLGAILNYRMNRKPTFYTSNHDLDGLQRHLSFTTREGEDEYRGQRLMDRIRPFVEVIEVGGRNQRGR